VVYLGIGKKKQSHLGVRKSKKLMATDRIVINAVKVFFAILMLVSNATLVFVTVRAK
jgi:hypothetical protein